MLNKSNSKVNAIQSLYKNLMTLVGGSTIKYTFEAEKYETLETRQAADQYLSAIEGTDTFLSYNDYTYDEYAEVGITNEDWIRNVIESGLVLSNIPKQYHEGLLKLRRQRTINEYVEKNNYYRKLAGLPNIECVDYDIYKFYVTEDIYNSYGISMDIPIHELEDYYNEENGTGTYKMSILEGLGYIDQLKEEANERVTKRKVSLALGDAAVAEEYKKYEYLDYLGSNKISLYKSRNAKNFQIIRLQTGTVSYNIYSAFLEIYEQSREYFVSTIYVSDFRNIIDYYDRFIAMCIMLMTLQQTVVRQIPYSIRRSFFDIYAIKALYETYGVPYNLKIDSDIQERLVQNLNLLIQNKSTDKVIFDIGSLLGLENDIKVYRYYLAKQQKFDSYGLPVIEYKNVFNPDTGEVTVEKDYERMYDIYFQKVEFNNKNFSTSFDDPSNRVSYTLVTDADPFWIEDSNLTKRVWESEYNFVESKYLGVGISYRLSDVIFKNITLIKLIMNNSNVTNNLNITLPKILGNDLKVSLFDAIIALICLLAAKHKLYGEIITIPSQIIAVLDFMRNTEEGDDYLVDTLGPDLNCFVVLEEDGKYNFELIQEVRDLLEKNVGEKEASQFMGYVENITLYASELSNSDKIDTINNLYENLNTLYLFITYMMSKTHDRKTYIALKQLYKAAFYTKEIKDVFTINFSSNVDKRTAKSFFEFLYYRNPKLYKALFKIDFQQSYFDYLTHTGNDIYTFSYEDYIAGYESGEIDVDFSTVNATMVDNEYATDEFIYTTASNIISNLSTYINDVDVVNMLGDSATVIESLFWKLVRFFKSYTTELIDFSNSVIFDMKTENMFRLFDEPNYIKKGIHLKDTLSFRYTNTIDSIESTIHKTDSFTFYERFIKEAKITIGKDYPNYNQLKFRDSIVRMTYIDDPEDDLVNQPTNTEPNNEEPTPDIPVDFGD